MTTRHRWMTVVGLAIVGVVIGATAAGAAPRELGWCFGSTWVTPSDLIDWWERINEWTFIALAGAAMLPEAGLIGVTGAVAETIEEARLIGGIVTGARMLWGSATGVDPVTDQPLSDFDRIMGVVPFLPHVAEGVFFGSGRGPGVEGETGVRSEIEPTSERPTEPFVERPTEPFVERPTEPFVERPTEPYVERPTEPYVERPVPEDTLPGVGPERVWTPEEQRPPGSGGQPTEEPPSIGPEWRWDPKEQAWERVPPEDIGTADTIPEGTVPEDIGTADTIPEGTIPEGAGTPPGGQPPTSYRELTPEEASGWVDIKVDSFRTPTPVGEEPPSRNIATPNNDEYEAVFRQAFGPDPSLPENGWIDDQGNVWISPESQAGERVWEQPVLPIPAQSGDTLPGVGPPSETAQSSVPAEEPGPIEQPDVAPPPSEATQTPWRDPERIQADWDEWQRQGDEWSRTYDPTKATEILTPEEYDAAVQRGAGRHSHEDTVTIEDPDAYVAGWDQWAPGREPPPYGYRTVTHTIIPERPLGTEAAEAPSGRKGFWEWFRGLFLFVLALAGGIVVGGMLRATPALADEAWDYFRCSSLYGGSSWGEPHIATYDGASYPFMVAGEFIATKSSVDDLEIQLRTEPLGGSRSVSVNTAVAANVGGDVVGIYLTEAGVEVRVDGVVTPVAAGIDLGHGGRVELRGDQHAVIWPDGTEIHVDVLSAGALYLRVSAFLPAERRGKVSGLFGDFDGFADDDIRPRGGGPAWEPQSFRFDLLYDDYADSWRIDKAESLFFYPPGTTTASFQLLDFPYGYETLATLPEDDKDRARVTCREAGVDREPFLSACIFDVAVTGDPSFAESGAALEAEVSESVAPFDLETLDGVAFDLLVGGEFVLLESEGGQADIQARFKAEFADGSPGMLMTAIALDVQGERVTVAAGNDPQIRVNGTIVEFPETGLLRLPGGGEIESASGSVVVSWPDGTALTIYTSNALSLEYNLSYPPTRQGRWVGGLLGGYDGKSENDFRIRDGTVIPQPIEMTPAFTARINGEFADSWRVREEERLFD